MRRTPFTGRREYYISDEYGSPVRYTDENGNTTGLYGYDEYGARKDLLSGISGNLRGYTTVNTEAEAYADGICRPFTFTGYMEDEVSGLYFAQAREYDPASGRFAGKDWVKGFADRPYTLNEYGYCWNSPKKYVDKDGRIPTVLIGAGVGFVVGGLVEFGGQVIEGLAEGKSFSESIQDVQIKDVVIQAFAGAAKGAIAGTGVGLVALAAANGGIDAAASVVVDITDGKEWDDAEVWHDAAVTGVSSAGSTLICGAIGNKVKLFDEIKVKSDYTPGTVDYINRHLQNSKALETVAKIAKSLAKKQIRTGQWEQKLVKAVMSYAAGEMIGGIYGYAQESVLGGIIDSVRTPQLTPAIQKE